MDEKIRAQVAELADMGVVLCDQGKLTEAEDLFASLWAVTQENVQVNSRLGVLRATRGAYAEAIAPLQAAVALDASNAIVLNVLSVCAFETGDYAAALANADLALARAPVLPEAHNSRGNALHRLGRDAEAVESFTTALRLEPDDPIALANLGNAQRNLGRSAEALANIERSLALDPSVAPVHVNRANVLQDLNRHAEALESYDRAVALAPQSADANWNRALCHLLTGDWASGWRGYEWRWRRNSPENRPRNFPVPLWLGQAALDGRSILIHGEQGLGDCLQFARYIPQVAARAGRVVVEVYPTLAELFGSLQGVEILPRGAAVPPTDFHCPMMSLPLALGETDAPAPAAAYLAPPAARRAAWAERIPPDGPLKVGLVVSGSATHGNDRRRSLPFETLSRFLPPGLSYHLLQKEIAPRDVEPLAARPDVTIWRDQLADFCDTAALVERMDVTISVDTSVAHLAGALGRPVWVLLPYDPDWRWGLRSKTTPWYVSARLYRQDVRDDWTGILARLAADLTAAEAARQAP